MRIVIEVNDELAEYFAHHNSMSDDGWFSHSSQLLNALRNGASFDKIRTEIESCEDKIDSNRDYDKTEYNAYIDAITDVLVIFDKYKTKSESQDKSEKEDEGVDYDLG